MKRIFLSLVLAIIGISAIAQQVAKSLTASNGVKISFYEYKPADYNSNTIKYPVIIFFHGIGERGNGTATELPRVLKNGIPKYIDRGHKMTFTWNGKTETFLVLSPQLSSSYGAWPAFYGEEMVAYAKENLRIDTNRIIVTGLSLGGGGVWTYAASDLDNARSVAAIGVVCGTKQSKDFSLIAKANLPVWAFHAEDDPTVNVSATNLTIDAINAANPVVEPIKTLWSTGGHVVWDRAFDTLYTWQSPNIFEWFLGQNKSLAPNKFPLANAGSDQSISISTTTATLDACKSTDSDGKIARYVWEQVSGPTSVSIETPIGSAPKTNVSGLTSLGDYVFRVTVYDERVGLSTDEVTITVTSNSNLAPKAVAGPDRTISTTSSALDGSQSSDDKGVVSYTWVQLSGPNTATLTNSKSAVASASNLIKGMYKFRLRVWDAQGLIGVDDVIITKQ